MYEVTSTSELTADLVLRYLSYDPDTGIFRWVSRVSPCSRSTIGSIAGLVHPNGYVKIGLQRRQHSAHRLAWLLTYGAPIPRVIDHIDGNRANNAIKNLRAASFSQNGLNTRKRRGISFDSCEGKYRTRIQVNGKRRYLGHFDSFEEARAAYIEAHIRLVGEFSPYAWAGERDVESLRNEIGAHRRGGFIGGRPSRDQERGIITRSRNSVI